MTAELLAENAGARAYFAPWQDLLEVVRAEGGCDALIVDAPYSKATHSGHDEGALVGDRAAKYAAGRYELGARALKSGRGTRRRLNYEFWTPADVRTFVAAWSPIVHGWFVSLTDDSLAPVWRRALDETGRKAFSPLACVEPGSRVRMSGDGPAQWACWGVVARPRGAEWFKWGALPGAYVMPAGFGERGDELRGRVVGAKPRWLCERLVADYSRPGDLIVDPCAGGFTTGRACQVLGRRFIGGDALREHAEMGAARIAKPFVQQRLFAAAPPGEQTGLFPKESKA